METASSSQFFLLGLVLYHSWAPMVYFVYPCNSFDGCYFGSYHCGMLRLAHAAVTCQPNAVSILEMGTNFYISILFSSCGSIQITYMRFFLERVVHHIFFCITYIYKHVNPFQSACNSSQDWTHVKTQSILLKLIVWFRCDQFKGF